MDSAAYAMLLAAALLGHAALWVGTVNRIHSTGMPRWGVKWLSLGCLAVVLTIPLILGCLALPTASDVASFLASYWNTGKFYFVPCVAIAVLAVGIWIRRRLTRTLPQALRATRVQQIDVAQQLGFAPIHGRFATLCSWLPGNQVFSLQVEEREIAFARLPNALDGLAIVHLSDFHITGRITPEYFQEVVRQANKLEPDFVAITGDVVDHAPYIDWLPDTLGRLKSKYGIFFILGNHDLRTHDVARVRRTLVQLGMTDVGGCWLRVDLRGEALVVAGNELPWIAPAADMRACVSAAVGIERDRPFRILLSHSPDQFAWAQRWDFDLVLAGHTHGGQFCLPVIGPLLSPSWHGVEYAGGTFAAGPTVMHVSRGTCSELPIRWNCPPELSKIVLRCATT